MIPGSANPLLLASAAAAGDYQVSRSLRFNSSDSAFCSRTPAVAGNRRTWTWAGWVKRSKLSASRQELFRCNTAPLTHFSFSESAQGNPESLIIYSGGSAYLLTTPVFRDISAWYHITVVFDTTNGTAGDRVKVYVNGSRITTFNTATYPSQNFDTSINTTNLHYIGASGNANEYFDGCLAEVFFIDGQALDPSSFTEVSATTGQLVPIAYTGTYGTNGFQLKFADNSAATAATLGADTSGNGNNWTPNNLSVTAGAGNDSLVDTPTSYGTDTSGVGGEVRGNYCTFNAVDKGSSIGLSNGNLQFVESGGGQDCARATFAIPSSGKWYWETLLGAVGAGCNIGIATSSTALTAGGALTGVLYQFSGYVAINGWGSSGAYGGAYTTNDVIGIAVNMDTGTITFYKNGSSLGAAYSSLSSAIQYFPFFQGTGNTWIANFGQRAFAYPLSGFKALCDTNLGDPLVAKPNELMDVVKYDGNGSTQTISGLNFSPDLVWIKSRNNSDSWHTVADTVRGLGSSGAYYRIFTNRTESELNDGYDITAITSTGFSLANGDFANNASRTYVAWAWNAGTSTVSNPDGSITSQVRANVSAGFSVVTWTADAGIYTVGHGLGVKPAMIIHKCRSNAETWLVRHVSIGDSGVLVLNTPAAAGTIAFGGTNTSTVFYNQNAVTTTSGRTMVAYCFAPVDGYSSMGSYVGNASADGPVVYLGFRPRFVIIKCSSTSNLYTNWDINDSARNTYNAADNTLCANLPDQENSVNIGGQPLDFLANGFKIRQATSSSKNLSGQTYIYYAVAENPFQYARAR